MGGMCCLSALASHGQLPTRRGLAPSTPLAFPFTPRQALAWLPQEDTGPLCPQW